MSYLVIDIETIATAVPEDAIEEKRTELAEEYVKAGTIEKHLEKWKGRFCFEPDGCEPVAIAACSVSHDFRMQEINGVCSAEPGLIAGFFAGLLRLHQGCTLVGYNVLNFDLPVLSRSLLRGASEEPLPDMSKIGRVIDLRYRPFGRDFNLRGGFKRLCRMFDVKLCGVDGSMVGNLWVNDLKDGTTKVLDYCKDDVRGCAELFCKLARIYEFRG